MSVCGGMCANESACVCVPVQVCVHVCACPRFCVHVHTYGRLHASVHMRVFVSVHAPSVGVRVHTDPHWYVYLVCLCVYTVSYPSVRPCATPHTSPCICSTPAQVSVRPRVRPCTRVSVCVSVLAAEYPYSALFGLRPAGGAEGPRPSPSVPPCPPGSAHSVLSAPWTEATAGEERRSARMGRPLRGCSGARVAPSAAASRRRRGAERGGAGL